jgi:nucleotide-binding universal stress UspA family protein
MSQTVVLALDRSVLSTRAVPFARTVAQLWRGRMVLVHATEHPRAGAIESQLTDVVRELRGEGINADVQLRRGPPAQVVVDVAGSEHADLIVMASHQRHGFDRWLHGSVTEDVLQHTSTPLLVVPALAEPSTRLSRRVLVPLDGSQAGEAALDFVVGLSSERPTEMLLLRIVQIGPVVVGWDPAFVVPPVSSDEIEGEVREAHAYLAERAESLARRGVVARRQVLETMEPVARVIRDTAQREHADAIALGTHGKGDVQRLVLGSVSEDVLEHSPVPVLLVRPGPGSFSRAGGAPALDLEALEAGGGAARGRNSGAFTQHRQNGCPAGSA